MKKILVLISILSISVIGIAQHALDPNFGNNGIVRTSFPATENIVSSSCQQVIPQQDGSFYLVISRNSGLMARTIITHRLANGAIDLNYGDNGNAVAGGVAALLPNGKMVIGSTTFANGGFDFLVVCLNANGAIDKTFGDEGRQVIDFMGEDHLNAIAISPDGKIVAVGYCNNGGASAVARLNIDGTPDNSFSEDGKLISFIMPNPKAVAITNTSRIIVAGGAVAAFLPNGEPDYSFGVNGVYIPEIQSAKKVAIQSDGKILLAAQSALFRLNTDGTLDNSFSDDGIQIIDTSLMDGLEDAAIDSDGRILIAGNKWTGNRGISIIARFTSTGMLDYSFSGDGSTTIDTHVVYTYTYSLAVQADGNLMVAGISYTLGDIFNEYYVSRMNNDGIPDSSFDYDGVIIDYPNIGYTEFHASVVQPDGKIICVGDARTQLSIKGFVIARFNPNGSFDSSFSQDGFASVRFEPEAIGTNFFLSIAYAVAVQPNGKIVVAGYSHTDHGYGVSNRDYALARLNADGSIDSSFSEDGKLITDLFGGDDIAYSVAIQPDGKIVAAGSSDHAEDPGILDFSMVRYNANGTLDNSFSWDGKQTTEFFSSTDHVAKVLIQPDGKIVVVGEAGYRPVEWSTGQDFGIARYRADGYADNSFGYNGAIRIDFQGNTDIASDAALLPDGTFLVSGTSEGHFAVAKLRPNGFLDSSFAVNGKKVIALSQGTETCNALAIQSNGSILLGGTINSSTYQEGDIAMIRLFANGNIDTSLSLERQDDLDFAAHGESIESINIYQGHIYAVGSGWYIDRVGIILSMKLDCSLGLSIPNAFALPVGVEPNTVYKGYAPAEDITLTAVANGKSPYTYLWNTGATTKYIRVRPNTTTTYDVTVTDASGCSQKISKTVNVLDVRCGNKNEKVLVCELEKGKWSKRKTVCVDPWMATLLLWKGSHLGTCPSDGLSSPNITSAIEEETNTFALHASPNPTYDQFALDINLNQSTKAELIITGVQGRIVERRFVNSSSLIRAGADYPAGIYMAELRQGEQRQVVKLVKLSR